MVSDDSTRISPTICRAGWVIREICGDVFQIRDRAQVQDQLVALAEKEHYACVRVDAKETKIHMMDKFFHQVARRIPWDALASQFVRRLAPGKWVSDPGRIKRIFVWQGSLG